ncbi:MAG: CRISPR-associated protein Cmr5 [Clostridiales bacterium]|jgi:CRISPR-associated protein Cmr5|nr:CRISPR-associated protein Cmr5 [Clostridiales bacterium]MDN5282463.1 CRISPR-associated protein Cmr5 [Candidatus Ozemobacter sp.]
MAITLEQKRAKHAWNAATGCDGDFKNLAKGAPAIVMSNGLMPSLAFWHSKGKKHHKKLLDAILGWLHERKFVTEKDFVIAMKSLQEAKSENFMKVTSETLEYLKWLRNFASALNSEE